MSEINRATFKRTFAEISSEINGSGCYKQPRLEDEKSAIHTEQNNLEDRVNIIQNTVMGKIEPSTPVNLNLEQNKRTLLLDAFSSIQFGSIYYRCKDYVLAEEAFRYGIEKLKTVKVVGPPLGGPLYRLGMALLSQGRDVEGEKMFRDAIWACKIADEGVDGVYQFALGKALSNQSKYAEGEKSFRDAIETFRSAGELDWRLGQSQRSLGFALLKQDKFSEAERAFEDAIESYKNANVTDGRLEQAKIGLEMSKK